MKREFLVNAFFLLLVNLLVKPFYVFGIERTIQDRVGAEAYGLYATLFSFSYLFFIINDLGLQQFNNRTIARHPHLLDKYFPGMLAVKIFLGFAYMSIVFLAAWLRGFPSEVYYLLFFIALNHLLISLVSFLRSNISGVGWYRTDSALSALDKVLLSIICGFLLWGLPGNPPFQIEWFVHAQNASWMLTALVALLLVRKAMSSPLRLRPKVMFALAVMKSAGPFALAIFLMTAYTRLDMVILEWMLPDGRHENGIYAAAYRLLDAFNILGLLFAGLLLPMYARLLRRRESEGFDGPASNELSEMVSLALRLIWCLTVPVAVSCFFFSEELMLWLYPRTATPYYGQVLMFTILVLVPFSGTYIISTLLTANGSLKRMNGLFALGIVLNVGLNLLLIPAYKAVGTALAALATQTLVFAGHLLLGKTILQLKPPSGGWRWGQLFAFFLLVTALAAASYYAPIPFHWLLRFSMSCLLGLMLALVLGLFKVASLMKFFHKESI